MFSFNKQENAIHIHTGKPRLVEGSMFQFSTLGGMDLEFAAAPGPPLLLAPEAGSGVHA